MSNEIKFDVNDTDYKYNLYRQFATCYCLGCSVVPLNDYANNEVYRELPRLNTIYANTDEKIFIDVRGSQGYTGELAKVSRSDDDLLFTITLKVAATNKK